MRVLMLLFVLMFLVGCSTLTEQQRVDRRIQWLEHEPDRLDKWGSYKDWCAGGGLMLWGPRSKTCRVSIHDCVPRRLDWDFMYKCTKGDLKAQMRCENKLIARNAWNWRAKASNSVQCMSKDWY